jgi:hypothetical protein
MKRITVNFIIDCVSFALLLCLTATGIILRYVLPGHRYGGGGGGWRGGRGAVQAGQTIQEFWQMTRHQWLDLHFWIAVGFVALMLIHILLHWNWITCYIKSAIKPAPKLPDCK